MSYTPPGGGTLALEFASGYTAPGGASVNLDAQPLGDVRQAGTQTQSAVSAPTVRLRARFAYPQGFVSARFGTTSVALDIPRLRPEGIAPTAQVGQPEYVSWPQFVDVDGGGIPSRNLSGWPLGNGRVRQQGGYSAPPAVNVVLDWPAGEYAAPPAINVILEFGAVGSGRILGATLFDQLLFGEPTVSQPLSLAPSGIASTTAFGTAVLSTAQREIYPSGWLSSAFGPTVFSLGALDIRPGGIAPLPDTGPPAQRRFPPPTVDFLNRTLAPVGIPSRTGQIPNTHAATREVQTIDLAASWTATATFGAAQVQFTIRSVFPPFFISGSMGTPLVARVQVLELEGWESSVLSPQHRLAINEQSILHVSGEADPAGYGMLAIRNEREFLQPPGWVSSEIAFHQLYNSDQYLQVGAYGDSDIPVTAWGAPTIANVDRTTQVFGWQSSRFPVAGPQVFNAASTLAPTGFASSQIGEDTFASFAVREVLPTGWLSGVFSPFAFVGNVSPELRPEGIAPAGGVGVPGQVANLNRAVQHYSPYDGSVFGTQFIASAVRTVTQLPPNAEFKIGELQVVHNPRTLAPAGIEPNVVPGTAFVFERFSRVLPPSTNVFPLPRIGQPEVSNRNRQVRPFPVSGSEFGAAAIFNFVQEPQMQGFQSSVFGAATRIEFRDRLLPLPGIAPQQISTFHWIRNLIPDPPAQQLLLPPSISYGPPNNPGAIVGNHLVRYPTIFPEGIAPMGGFGAHAVSTNAIRANPWPFNLDQVGTPSLSATQFIYPRIIPWPNAAAANPESSSDQNWVFSQRPRVNPHTIYAPEGTEATQQARTNNPAAGTPERIDQFLTAGGHGAWSLGSGWPWFGRPEVSNANRTIGPVPTHTVTNLGPTLGPSSRYGQPTVDYFVRRLFPQPIRSSRFGLPSFPFTPQTVSMDPNLGHDSMVIGAHTAGPPPFTGPRTILVPGIMATLWGTNRVEPFDRTVFAAGTAPSQLWGETWVSRSPRTVIAQGWLSRIWGDNLIEFKDRPVYPQGWDSLSLIADDVGSFDDRMRVLWTNPPSPMPSIPPTSAVGSPLVGLATRELHARGVTRALVGAPAVHMVLSPEGWSSHVVGNVDRWEENVLKTAGYDMSEFGMPGTAHTIHPDGADTAALGAVVAARALSPLGIPEIGFAGPAVTNPFGCNNRVVSPLPILATMAVPEPEVS